MKPNQIGGQRLFKDQMTKKLPYEMARNGRSAMEQGANEIVSDMKVNAPKKSGDLMRSIDWKWAEGAGGGAPVYIGSGKGRRLTHRLAIFAGGKLAWYARIVEFGSVKWVGNPFFFFTYRNHKRRVKSRITRALSSALKKAMR